MGINRRWSAAFVLLTVCVGCEAESLDYTEVKRIDERITAQELTMLLRIAQALPDQKLPSLPAVFVSPPQWNEIRTLPVSELVAEEQRSLAERWSGSWIVQQLERNRPLHRVLQRERITPEQFAGLVLATGAALSRSTLRESQDLDKIIARGEPAVERLRRETRSFALFSQEARHYLLQQAAWLTRVDRAQRLKQVPAENVALVSQHRTELERVFPAEFLTNPLDSIADRLEEEGLPFEEQSASGRDAEITWDPREAIIGIDHATATPPPVGIMPSTL